MEIQMRLASPTLAHEERAWAYRQEHIDFGEDTIHGDGGLDHAGSYAEWLEKLSEEGAPSEGSGLVPASTLLAMVEDEIVGVIQIRHGLTEHLAKFGGHIGYSVRPTKRRAGCATKMLSLALERCREMNMERVLVTCNKDNTASARTIEKNGGILENEIAEPDGNLVLRYWISLA